MPKQLRNFKAFGTITYNKKRFLTSLCKTGYGLVNVASDFTFLFKVFYV